MGCCTAIESATLDSSDVYVVLALAVYVNTLNLVCTKFAAAVGISAVISKVTEPFALTADPLQTLFTGLHRLGLKVACDQQSLQYLASDLSCVYVASASQAVLALGKILRDSHKLYVHA